MSKDSIKLSEKHGVNPSVLICPICGKGSGVALLGRLKEDAEAPREMIDMGPCEACVINLEQYKEMGFLFLVVDDIYEEHVERGGNKNIWPFFRFLNVVKRDCDLVMNLDIDKSQGVAVMCYSTALKIGLKPSPEENNVPVTPNTCEPEEK